MCLSTSHRTLTHNYFSWGNTWESDSWRPRHPRALDHQELLMIEGPPRTSADVRQKLHLWKIYKMLTKTAGTCRCMFTAVNSQTGSCLCVTTGMRTTTTTNRNCGTSTVFCNAAHQAPVVAPRQACHKPCPRAAPAETTVFCTVCTSGALSSMCSACGLTPAKRSGRALPTSSSPNNWNDAGSTCTLAVFVRSPWSFVRF